MMDHDQQAPRPPGPHIEVHGTPRRSRLEIEAGLRPQLSFHRARCSLSGRCEIDPVERVAVSVSNRTDAIAPSLERSATEVHRDAGRVPQGHARAGVAPWARQPRTGTLGCSGATPRGSARRTSAGSASRARRRRPLPPWATCSSATPTAAASSAIVWCANNSFGVSVSPSRLAREMIWMLRIESPPSSKKLSYTPTCSTRSTWDQIAASFCSSAVRGATYRPASSTLLVRNRATPCGRSCRCL